MSEKKRFIRFIPLLGGVLALTLSFISFIPIGSSYILSLSVLQSSNVEFYIWGMVEGGSIWFSFLQITVDNLLSFLFWIFMIISGICGVIGTSYKANPKISKKLLLLGGFFALMEFGYFTFVYFFQYGNFSLGIGYPVLGAIMAFYFLSAGLVTDY